MNPRRCRRQQGRLPTPLLAMLIAVGLIIGLFVLLLFAPAGLVNMVLERSGADAHLLSPSGRVHRGSGQLQIEQRDWGEVTWRLRPTGLLRGHLEVDFTLDGAGHEAVATARLAPGRQRLTGIEGRLTESGLSELLAAYDIYPSGDVTLTDGSLEAQGNTLTAVHGDAHWSGGSVRYFLAGQGWTVALPPLDARLRLIDGQPLLVVLDPAGDELLDVRLDLQGWAHLRVRYRFIAMVGFPWPESPAPDTILLELSERVL